MARHIINRMDISKSMHKKVDVLIKSAYNSPSIRKECFSDIPLEQILSWPCNRKVFMIGFVNGYINRTIKPCYICNSWEEKFDREREHYLKLKQVGKEFLRLINAPE